MKALDHIASAFLRRILRRMMKQLGVNRSEQAKRMKVSKPYITKVLRQDVNLSFAPPRNWPMPSKWTSFQS